MRIVKKSRLRDLARRHSGAESGVEHWITTVESSQWSNFADLRNTYSSADQVTVKSGSLVTVFNIGGNSFRLIAAIHYETQIAFIRDFLTHAEYSKDRWKLQH